MTVATTENNKSYVGDGNQFEFSFPYLVYDEDHLHVYFDGIEQSTNLYSLQSLGSPAGIVVVFVNPPGSGVVILLRRIVPNTQLSEYVENDPLRAFTIERDFDLAAMRVQQIFDNAVRMVRAPLIEETIDMVLPNIATRANKVLQFDANGLPSLISQLDQSGTTVTALGTDAVARSLAAHVSEPTNVKNFGAAGNGTSDDTTPIRDAMLAAGEGGVVFFPAGNYLVNSTITIPSKITLFGYGATLTLDDDVDTYMLRLSPGTTDVIIDGLELDGNGANNTGTPEFNALFYCDSNAANPSFNIVIRNCHIRHSYSACIQFGEAAVDCLILGNRVGPSIDNTGINIARGFGNCKRFIVANNIVDNCPRFGIGATSAIQQCVFANNFIRDTGTHATFNGDSITAYHEDNVDIVVSGNSCLNGSNNGIHISGRNLSITGNVVKNIATGGITVGSSAVPAPAAPNVTISGNSIDGCFRGIWTRNVINATIVGNAIDNATDRSIYLQFEQTANAHDNPLVNGNNIQHTGTGPAIQSNGAINKGIISGNLVIGGAGAPSGIELHNGAVGFTVSGNRVTGFTNGIVETNPSTGNFITGNNLLNNTTGILLVDPTSTTNCNGNRAAVTVGFYTIPVVGSDQEVTIPADSQPFVGLSAGAGADINDFVPKWAGRTLYLTFADSNITLKSDSATLVLAGGTDKSPSSGDIIQLISDGTAWYQAATLQDNS